MPHTGDDLRQLMEVKIFESPASRQLGWKCLDVDPESGSITTQFEAKEEFINPGGAIQGGFLSAMLDNTLSPAIYSNVEPDQYPVTLDMNVSYIKAARTGTLIGHGRVVRRGKSIAFLAGELQTLAGELIATATATARIIDLQKD